MSAIPTIKGKVTPIFPSALLVDAPLLLDTTGGSYRLSLASGGNQTEYATRLAAANAVVDETVDFLRVSGYAVIGDGGGGSCWKRVASQPSHLAWFQSVGGVYWEYCVERSIVLPHLGGLGDGTTPCDDALTAAWSLLADASGRNCIAFGSGTFLFVHPVSKTLPFNNRSVTLIGEGSRSTILNFPDAGGLEVWKASWRNAIHMMGFSVYTGKQGVGTAISLRADDYVTTPQTGYSSMYDVECRGSDYDGYGPQNYWGTCVYAKVWGLMNVMNCTFLGPEHHGGTGMLVEGNSASGLYAIVWQISQCFFNCFHASFIYGDYVQGVTINQCNFTGGSENKADVAIQTLGSYTGLLAQLTISNSQFDVGNSCILLFSPMFNLQLVNNIFTVNENGVITLNLFALGFNITGNVLNVSSATGVFGITLAAGSRNGTIVGNSFANQAVAVALASGTTKITVSDNSEDGVTTSVIDNGTGNVVGTGVASGGTGLTTILQGDLLYGSATNAMARLAKSATATRYLANTGTSNNPAWDQVDLTNGVKNTLPVANGGTGQTTVSAFKTALTLVKGDVGLGNVDNTSDATKNAASATLTNKTLTSPVINSPTGIVKGDVGLGNVDNTSDASKPVSTAQATAIAAKVTGPGVSNNFDVAIFVGTTGKVLTDSGYVVPGSAFVGVNDSQTLTGKTIDTAAASNTFKINGTTVATAADFQTALASGTLAFKLSGANFNSTADQAITLTLPTGFTRYRFQAVNVSNPSTSLTTAVGGIYTAAAKGGIAVIAASQVYSALTTNTAGASGSMLIPTVTNAATAFYNSTTLYLSLTTAQGSAATADVTVIIQPLP